MVLFAPSKCNTPAKYLQIMATTKFYLDKRATRKDGKFPLKVSISHKGKTSLIGLDVFISAEHWNDKAEKITGGSNRIFLNNFITRRKLDIDTILLQLMERGEIGKMTVTQIKDKVLSELMPEEEQRESGVFIKSFLEFIGLKKKPNTIDVYKATLKKIQKFDPNYESLNFEDINREWLVSFDSFLAQTSPSKNARNIHLRNIRAVFNEAIDNEVTSSYPFRKFKIKGEATIKRSLTVEQIRMLFSYPVEEHQVQYLDMFKLIFYLIGINTVDLFSLTKENIEGGRLLYHRAKTGRLYDIKLEPEAVAIIEKYKGDSLLLNAMDRYESYRVYSARLNRMLQQIGYVSVGKNGKKTHKPLFPNITTYWARHTWATIASSLDIPKETIAAALGHGGNSVTDIYINFDQKKVDEANRRVIDYVLYGK